MITASFTANFTSGCCFMTSEVRYVSLCLKTNTLFSTANMTHSYILKKDRPPQFEHCQCILRSVPQFDGSAIISLRQEMIYLVDVVWWNLFNSTLN